jgi:UDP-N-acetylmuramate dehydrogenase
MKNNNYLLKIKKHSVCFYENENMADHVSFKAGGNAKYYCEPKSNNSLAQIIKLCKENNLRYFILGNGTNTLFYSFDGLIICTKQLREITVMESGDIFCDAGVEMFRLNMFASQCGLSGMEWSYGIPGTVGGAIKMNAGAYGGEMSHVVEDVKVFDGKRFKSLSKDKLSFGYRNSFLYDNPDWVVTKVHLKLTKLESNVEIKEKMFELFEKRKNNHPLEYPSAGSVFKRKDNVIPAVLIEQIGIKGTAIGGAEISTKHCGFIINKNKASVEDIENLMNFVKTEVKKATGIELEREVIVIKE